MFNDLLMDGSRWSLETYPLGDEAVEEEIESLKEDDTVRPVRPIVTDDDVTFQVVE